jgi:ATP-dependent Clp protease adaptor protein ClpS
MTQTKTRPETEADSATELVDPWHVVVLNDPVNLMSYVVLVFKRVFGYDEVRARRHMLEVHQRGRSVVWTGNREKAEAYVHTLHQWQLTAVLEHGEAN